MSLHYSCRPLSRVFSLFLFVLVPGQLFALDQYRLTDSTTDLDGHAQMTVLLTNDTGVVRDFSIAVEGGPGVLIDGFNLSGTVTEGVGAEFVEARTFGSGGTLRVILDAEPPMNAQSIPIAVDQAIANVELLCFPPFDPNPASATSVGFVNGVYGNPPVVNRITAASSEVMVELVPGMLTCIPVPLPNTVFLGGALDRAAGVVKDLWVRNGRHKYSFYYTDPDDSAEGFQFVVSHDCTLVVLGGFTVEGTVLALTGVEFIGETIDSDVTDGDGCDYVVEVLFDALPPFINQSLAPAPNITKVGSFILSVPFGLPVGTTLDVTLDNSLVGNGLLPLSNQLKTDTRRIEVQELQSHGLELTDLPTFIRGDCNGDSFLDISDGVFLLLYLFLAGTPPSCPVACDINDDTVIDPSDFVRHIGFLFLGAPKPEFPYPSCGTLAAVNCPVGTGCP